MHIQLGAGLTGFKLAQLDSWFLVLSCVNLVYNRLKQETG